MCQIIIKPKGLLTNIPNLDRAKEKNKDGFGVMWYDESTQQTKVFKSLDYEEFKSVVIEEVKENSAVIHLRFASRGAVTLDNVHPFKTSKDSWLCHNGTLQSWGNATTSDTKEFADTFKALDIDWELPETDTLVGHTIGTAYNKIVIMGSTGHIKVFNKNLFIEEEGILYSNTGHHETVYYTPYKVTEPYRFNRKERGYYDSLWDDVNDTAYTAKSKEKIKVFVYGTLKQGRRNHGYLAEAKFLYKAQTLKKFAMVGKDAPFPYLLGESEQGHQIIGEVYEIDEDIKEALDILEGNPHHYMEQEIIINPIYKFKDTETVGFSNVKVTTYTKSDTTKRPSLLALYPKEDYIKEW